MYVCVYIYIYIYIYIYKFGRDVRREHRGRLDDVPVALVEDLCIYTYISLSIYIYICTHIHIYFGLDQLAAQHPMSRHIRHIHNENRLNSDNLQHHAKWRGACWRREWLKAPSEPTQGVGMETAGGPAWARAHQGRPVPALAPGPANFAPEQGRAPLQGVGGMRRASQLQGFDIAPTPWTGGHEPGGHPFTREHAQAPRASPSPRQSHHRMARVPLGLLEAVPGPGSRTRRLQRPVRVFMEGGGGDRHNYSPPKDQDCLCFEGFDPIHNLFG